jgi:exonuclease VII large subunit
VAAEKIVWNSAEVVGQIAGLRETLNRCLDDASTSLRQAQNRLRRQDVPFALAHSVDASIRRLERIRENAQALWRGTQRAQETLDQAERELVAFASALIKGEDAVLPLPRAGGGPFAPSPFAGYCGTSLLMSRISAQVANDGETDGGYPFPSASLTIKPIVGIDAMLKGRMTVSAAWTAPRSVSIPWLERLLARSV